MCSILIVEDEFDIRENLQELLESEGFSVTVACDGVQGFESAKKHKPDLILSDVRMPEMDGIELLRKLQDDPETSAIPFIFLSAKVELVDIRQGMMNGADDYITKPFKSDEVLKVIDIRLKKKENYRNIINDFRNSFVKNVPHELRTPLISILGFSEMIESDIDSLSPAEIKEMVQRINKSGRRLHKRIEKLIQYGFLISLAEDVEENEMRLQFGKDFLSGILSGTAKDFGRTKDLRVDTDQAVLKIKEGFLTEMILELTDNAFKFSTPGTPVIICGRKNKGVYRLSVEDRGIGIDVHSLEEVEHFNKLDREHTNREGLGLGLAIIKKISGLSGVKINITSEKNSFTRFDLDIPLCKD